MLECGLQLGGLFHLPYILTSILPASRARYDPEARVLHRVRSHGGGVHYRGILRMRGGIQAGLPRVQELLLLENQSRFFMRVAAAVGLRELLLEEDLRVGLGWLMLQGLVCLIVVKGLLCESLLMREEG